MRAPLLAVVCLVTVVFAGCVHDRDERRAVTTVGGVPPSADGDVALRGGNGLDVVGDPTNASLRLSLGPALRVDGTVQACRAGCDELTVAPGMVLAEGSLLSLHNASLNAAGPDRSSALYFYESGRQDGAWIGWDDAWARFATSHDLQSGGNLSAVGSVGSRQRVAPTVELATAATEGLESTVFLRGSGRLENGTATLVLPDLFTLLVGDGPITVQVTLTSRGPTLYVQEKAATHVIVATADGTESDATFDLFVQAVRKGMEDFSVVRTLGP